MKRTKYRMSREQIIAAIDEEIGKLRQVRKLLESAGGSKIAGIATGSKQTGRRTLSPEARERIAAAQRRRWAKQKKAAGK